MGFERFTDIRAWKSCRSYKRAVARFVRTAHSSLLESQNHLVDAVDAGWISDAVRSELDMLAVVAIRESASLIDYLQSPQAQRNADRAKGKRTRTRNAVPEPEP